MASAPSTLSRAPTFGPTVSEETMRTTLPSPSLASRSLIIRAPMATSVKSTGNSPSLPTPGSACPSQPAALSSRSTSA